MSTAQNARTAALEAVIVAHATELKLPTIRRRFKALADEATREQQAPVAYLAALMEAEIAERSERREKRRLIDARFPALKYLQDFRFDENQGIPQATIAALAEGSWITDRESVILIGDSGTGKTHLATALGIAACQQGRRVRFTTLAALANELQEAHSQHELARVIGRYTRTSLAERRITAFIPPAAQHAQARRRPGRPHTLSPTGVGAAIDRITHGERAISELKRHGAGRGASVRSALSARRPSREAS